MRLSLSDGRTSFSQSVRSSHSELNSYLCERKWRGKFPPRRTGSICLMFFFKTIVVTHRVQVARSVITHWSMARTRVTEQLPMREDVAVKVLTAQDGKYLFVKSLSALYRLCASEHPKKL